MEWSEVTLFRLHFSIRSFVSGCGHTHTHAPPPSSLWLPLSLSFSACSLYHFSTHLLLSLFHKPYATLPWFSLSHSDSRPITIQWHHIFFTQSAVHQSVTVKNLANQGPPGNSSNPMVVNTSLAKFYINKESSRQETFISRYKPS